MNSKLKSVNSTDLKSQHQFPVVGIGASAGGLDAFKKFLKAIPNNSGMAFVVVQHLDPSHESILPEILAKIAVIPVLEITDEIKLQPDHVYVIPSNKTLISTDGILKLCPRKNPNLVIDKFFKTLAEVHESLAVGIVLSGTGADGTQGLMEIKAHGGMTFAQDVESSAYESMPNSAVAAKVVDFVMSPDKMPGQLIKLNSAFENRYLDPQNALSAKEEKTISKILSVLKARSGVDFAYYKQTTIRRRLARRIAITNTNDFSGYLKLLEDDISEQTALFNDVLIPVTSFFRDTKIFQSLTEIVFPSLLKNKNDSEPFRFWSAACSTGEEVYSLAICIQEFLKASKIVRKVSIFGSDISEASVAKARLAIYQEADIEHLPTAIVSTYFTKRGHSYQVEKSIRDMCVFTVHNFVKDPPFARMDLVCCRNVLIYMDVFLQNKALSIFHYALRDYGFLFLGKSETIAPAADLFNPFIKSSKIYSRSSAPVRFAPIIGERLSGGITKKNRILVAQQNIKTDFKKSAEALLLSNYVPVNVVVNEQLDVQHISGDISAFLQPPQGKPNYNIIKMAQGSLGFELRTAVHRSKQTNLITVKKNIFHKVQKKNLHGVDRGYTIARGARAALFNSFS